MRTLIRAAIVTAIAATLAVPAASHAADEPRRVAQVSSNHPSVDSPVPGATGRAVLAPNADAGEICYRYTWEDMEMRRLDLRRRSSGAPVALLYDENPTTSGRVSGCTTSGASVFQTLTPRQVREVRDHPLRFYVEASTYTGDTIAGNLHRPR